MNKLYTLAFSFFAFTLAGIAQCSTTDQLHSNHFGLSGQDGIMFDINAINTVSIQCFSSYFTTGSLTVNDFEIWYKPGSYIGAQTDQSQWTFIGRTNGFVLPQSQSTLTQIPIQVNVTIPAGMAAAFYITNGDSTNSISQGIRYDGSGSTGSVTSSDANIQIMDGAGAYSLFTVFSGSRIFSGQVQYNTGTVGIESQKSNALAVFPNPSSDVLTIQTRTTGLARSVTIIDVSGSVVLQKSDELQEQTQIDVSSLPRGTYVIRIATKEAVLTEVFVKG